MHSVLVRGSNQRFEVPSGTTVLDGARAAGILIPYDCRRGACGSCKVRLVNGTDRAHLLPGEALRDADKRAGYALACRTLLKGPVEIELVEALPAMRALHVRVVSIARVACDVRILRVEPEASEALAFRAGQYALLGFSNIPERAYSMANRPGSPILEFHIRLFPQGGVSRYIEEHLQIGERVALRGPFGQAVLGHQRQVIGVAGGTGFAPIQSITEEALSRHARPDLRIYWGVKSVDEVYARPVLERWRARGVQVAVAVSRPGNAGHWRHGRAHELLAEYLSRSPVAMDTSVYLAGPPALIEAAYDVCIAAGVPHTCIHMDPFTAAILPSTPPTKRGFFRRLFSGGSAVPRSRGSHTEATRLADRCDEAAGPPNGF